MISKSKRKKLAEALEAIKLEHAAQLSEFEIKMKAVAQSKTPTQLKSVVRRIAAKGLEDYLQVNQPSEAGFLKYQKDQIKRAVYAGQYNEAVYLAEIRVLERMARRDFPTSLPSWEDSANAPALPLSNFSMVRDQALFDLVSGLITNFVAPYTQSQYTATGWSVKSNQIFEHLAQELSCDAKDILMIEGPKLRFAYDDARIEFCKFSGLSYDKYAKSWDVAEPEDFDDFIEAFAENFCIILDLQGFAIHWRIDNEEVAEPKPLARV